MDTQVPIMAACQVPAVVPKSRSRYGPRRLVLPQRIKEDALSKASLFNDPAGRELLANVFMTIAIAGRSIPLRGDEDAFRPAMVPPASTLHCDVR
jgi:hypothetical protein